MSASRLACLVAFWLALACGALAAEAAWRYEVRMRPGGWLEAEGWYKADSASPLEVNEGAFPFVSQVAAETGSGWVPLHAVDQRWRRPPGATHVRWRVQLRAAAARLKGERAGIHGADIVDCEPGVFLLHPSPAPAGTRYRLQVSTIEAGTFACGMREVAPATWESDAADLEDGARVAFGPLRVTSLPIGGSVIRVACPARGLPLDAAAWVRAKAEAVARYYRRFPVPTCLVLVAPQPGKGINGHTEGGGACSIVIDVGTSLSASFVTDDWTLTHEMVHLAFPSVPWPHHWIEEGLATYLEPVIRARAGDLSSARVWTDLVEGLPQGQPARGDGGLDGTRSWGRTYWGGALFCFVADMEIRLESGGARSLDDAVRGIVANGGNLTRSWPLDRALRVGDAATGRHVLTRLYAAWRDRPVRVDLDAWWRRLGVRTAAGRGVKFDDHAPLAALRRAVTSPQE